MLEQDSGAYGKDIIPWLESESKNKKEKFGILYINYEEEKLSTRIGFFAPLPNAVAYGTVLKRSYGHDISHIVLRPSQVITYNIPERDEAFTLYRIF